MLKITSKLTADRFNPGLAGTLLEIMLYFTVTNFCKVSNFYIVHGSKILLLKIVSIAPVR